MTDYQKLFSLVGKRALITGGTGGLGSQIAAAFLQNEIGRASCRERVYPLV